MVWIALFSWPLVAAVFFRLWSVPVATTATLIGGYLLLPEVFSIDLPLLPPLDKHTIPAISAVILVWRASAVPQKSKSMLPGILPKNGMILLFLGFIIVGAFGTVITNQEPLFYGPRTIVGMRLYDSFSIVLTLLVTLTPFLIARKIMASPEGQKGFVTAFVIAAVAYAFLALWEIRMSPQLNKQIYGFFPHSWIQHIRGGGFRPLVFLEHGLWLGIFFTSAVITALGMARYTTGTKRRNYFLATGWLFITLFLSKVLGAFAIALVLLPIVFVMSQRIQLMIAASISVVVLAYPVLRNTDLIPTQAILAYAEDVDPQRAQSLQFRFDNEDILLDHAQQKPAFGWGGYGRNFVFDEVGNNTTISDGHWVVVFGKGGWFNYIGEYGLMTWGILALFFRRRRDVDNITVVLALALAANLIDLLPNAGLSPVTWILAGILAGKLEQRNPIQDTEAPHEPSQKRKTLRYAREVKSGKKHTRSRKVQHDRLRRSDDQVS